MRQDSRRHPSAWVWASTYLTTTPASSALAGASQATLAMPARVMVGGVSPASRSLAVVSKSHIWDDIPWNGTREWQNLGWLGSGIGLQRSRHWSIALTWC